MNEGLKNLKIIAKLFQYTHMYPLKKFKINTSFLKEQIVGVKYGKDLGKAFKFKKLSIKIEK